MDAASTLGVSLANNDLEQVKVADETILGLRILRDGRMGFATTNRPAEVAALVEEAVAIGKASPVDDLATLPDAAPVPEAEDVLDRVRDFYSPAAESSEIDLRFAPMDELPPLWVDPDRLEQILGNLISNSIKFTPHGGGIRVFAARDETHVAFLVEDDGPGISDEDQEHLFERFFQVRTDKGITGKGAGLGLSIARALVTEVSPPGTVSMTFHFHEAPTNVLTNAAYDPVAKIPETKVCAVRVEAV